MHVVFLSVGRVRPDGFPSQAQVEVGDVESTYWGTFISSETRMLKRYNWKVKEFNVKRYVSVWRRGLSDGGGGPPAKQRDVEGALLRSANQTDTKLNQLLNLIIFKGCIDVYF